MVLNLRLLYGSTLFAVIVSDHNGHVLRKSARILDILSGSEAVTPCQLTKRRPIPAEGGGTWGINEQQAGKLLSDVQTNFTRRKSVIPAERGLQPAETSAWDTQ
ncbi:hypothetical protein XENOCAPTIV_007902, partial [Xenoophorus captivus]